MVSNKRGQIAQIIREKFPEKNFPFPIVSTEAAVKNSQVLCQNLSHFVYSLEKMNETRHNKLRQYITMLGKTRQERQDKR